MIMFLNKDGFFQFKYTIEQTHIGFLEYNSKSNDNQRLGVSQLDLFPFEWSDIDEVSLSLIDYADLKGKSII